ncbi:uncharacterized protein [Euwallacea similis]|uniref:uncharacterized protein isoform X1 n=1 Tax=Euwallacea similis TaxID=1736056 RepID=UPI00344B2FC3
MVDVDKFSDAELRTKLLEFGFPVMPITGTTRKIMAKKLKLLLENRDKTGSRNDNRRSLGKYSSEDESDTDVKAVKNQKNRRVTMGPVSSTSRTSMKSTEEQEEVSSSPHKPIRAQTSSTNTSTITTSKVIRPTQDYFDTGSDSESDVVVSSNKNFISNSRDEDSFDDMEFNRRPSAKSPFSSTYASFSSGRNVSFSGTSSPSRHTSYGETAGLAGSLASDYAADKLNQIRTRLSVGSPAYDRPYSPASEVKLTERDTPFLSNFTRRLSALSTSKKGEFDNKSDLVKEHDSNGMYGRSYLSNFRATKGRDPTYEYKTRQSSGGKSNFVSYGVLAVAAMFFILLAVVYLGMMSDTSMVTSGFISPICDFDDPEVKRGVNCIPQDETQNAINLLNSIKSELHKRAVAHRCFDSTIKPQMTELEIVSFCQTNYAIKDAVMIRRDLKNLEVMTFVNPEWGIVVAQTEKNDGAIVLEDVVKNMEQVVFNQDIKITSLVILEPNLPYKCVFLNYVVNVLYALALIGIIFVVLILMRYVFKIYTLYEQKQKNEVNALVEKILEILQNTSCEHPDTSYVVINHVRDAILSVKERKAKQHLWEKAIKYINENESRVRTEVQTVHGESFDVWRWIGSANLSMTGDTTDFTYLPGRRIVDVDYLINQLLQFPHRPLFFCRSADITIKNEIREGFFSIYVLRCNRCLREHSICNEEPKTEMLDVNLAFVAGILSLKLDLYQLNELCSAIHIPTISGKDFNRYKAEIKEIYNDSKSKDNKSGFVNEDILTSTPKQSQVPQRLITALGVVDSSIIQPDFENKKKAFLCELDRSVDAIEVLTKSQKDCELWLAERKKRLTASNFGKVCKLLNSTDRTNVAKNILYSTFKGNIYTKYGQEHEQTAIMQFEQVTGKKVQKCGLVVHKAHSFLAASPDGVIEEEKALVEIKCPYKARESTIEQAFFNKEITFATFEGGKLKLKKNDKYYYQVQGQLHVTNHNFCYFVVWTPKGMAFEVIERDVGCWEEMFPKLEKFYFEHMLPEILTNA